MPPVRVLVLGGSDRLRFLQALVAQDLAGLAPGDATYGALTDERGRPIADFHLYVLPEAVLLELPAGCADAARAALDGRIIADDVRTAWAEGGVVAYESSDPARLPAHLAATAPTPGIAFAAAGGFADGDAALEDEAVLATVPAVRDAVLRASRLGGFGALHWAAGDRMAELAAAAAGSGVTIALSATQLDPLEIAAGRISAAELAEAKVWNELGVMSAVSLTKGCWMGQEIVRRVHVLGETRRLLRGLTIATPHGVGWAGATLEDAAGAAGVVTRAARAPFLDATIGLAFVRRELAPGATMTARRADGAVATATVHPLPFVARRPAGVPEPTWIPRENA